jgi:hypothetical protein
MLLHSRYHSLKVVLIGPHVQPSLHGTLHDENVDISGLLCKLLGQPTESPDNTNECNSTNTNTKDKETFPMKVQYCHQLYHEYVESRDPELFTSPTAAFCFQAGVWGYGDWVPTISLLVFMGHVLFVN